MDKIQIGQHSHRPVRKSGKYQTGKWLVNLIFLIYYNFLCAAMPLISLNNTISVDWKSDMIELEIWASKSQTYSIAITVNGEKMTSDCTKHCQVHELFCALVLNKIFFVKFQKVRLERRKMETVISVLNKTMTVNSGFADKIFVETNQPNLFMKVLDGNM
jgi:hypothetical protein